MNVKNPIWLLAFTALTLILFSCAQEEAGPFVRNNPLDNGGTNWHPPVVTAMADVSQNINDSVTVTAMGTDNGSIVKYVWARNGGSAFGDTTVMGSLKVAYADTGRKYVIVKVVDDDGAVSVKADTCVVRVTLDPPVVTVMHDTAVSFAVTDSVVVTAHAVDTNASGSIVRYLWDTGADGVWDDSAATGLRIIKSATGGPVTVRWGARDDDGVLAVATFCVLFNRPPNSPVVTAPTTSSSWISFSGATGQGTLPLALSATDLDGVVDALRYTLFTGATAGVLTQQYTGTAATYNLTAVDSSGTVYWRLVVRDKLGDSAIATGSFIAPPAPPPPPPAGMKLIAAGTFDMGRVDVAEAVHSVTLSAFWMDSTEVTQADYLALMGVNPSHFNGVTRGPVENITWFDAVLYCNKRSKRDGKDTVYKYTSITGTAGNGCTALGGLVIDTSKSGYRLPTEAQWEYACRAGTTTDYYWGSNTIDNYAWYYDNSGSTTHTVATKLPNAWGLYDMSGNVWELCNDWYGSTYGSGLQTNPQGATSGSSRVLRGGSWSGSADLLRSAYWGKLIPDYRYNDFGFRVVLPSRV